MECIVMLNFKLKLALHSWFQATIFSQLHSQSSLRQNEAL